MNSSIKRVFCFLAIVFAAEVHAIPKQYQKTVCNSNEIGIGVSEVDSIKYNGGEVTGEGRFGTIYAHNCRVLDLSQFDDPWKGGWHSWYGVTSKDYGPPTGIFPTEVRTPDGIYNDCIQLSGRRNCDFSGETYYLEAAVSHCCKWSAPNPDAPQDKAGTSEDSQGDTEAS